MDIKVSTKPNFYLTQRGKVNMDGKTFNQLYPISWDYMGSSNFEGGTVGVALAALGYAMEQKLLTCSQVELIFGPHPFPMRRVFKEPKKWLMCHTEDYQPSRVIDYSRTQEVPCREGTTLMLPIADTFGNAKTLSLLEKQPCCFFVSAEIAVRDMNILSAAMENRMNKSIAVFRKSVEKAAKAFKPINPETAQMEDAS